MRQLNAADEAGRKSFINIEEPFTPGTATRSPSRRIRKLAGPDATQQTVEMKSAGQHRADAVRRRDRDVEAGPRAR